MLSSCRRAQHTLALEESSILRSGAPKSRTHARSTPDVNLGKLEEWYKELAMVNLEADTNTPKQVEREALQLSQSPAALRLQNEEKRTTSGKKKHRSSLDESSLSLSLSKGGVLEEFMHLSESLWS